ncbi:MAG: hypothetical protein AAF655_12120 [Bacteroidota bacterium]
MAKGISPLGRGVGVGFIINVDKTSLFLTSKAFKPTRDCHAVGPVAGEKGQKASSLSHELPGVEYLSRDPA